jgi:hypothetical protein
VAVDPGMPSFRFVYHRAERNLLHIPTSVELEGSPLAGRCLKLLLGVQGKPQREGLRSGCVRSRRG